MASDEVRIHLSPAGLSYRAAAGETLLAAANRAGVAVPAACRNGVCELCEARLIAGEAVNTRNQHTIPIAGRLMMCRTLALSDLELEIDAIMAAGENHPRKFQAKVVDVRSISHDVYRVELQLPRRRELSFHAGQYLSVNLPDTDPCYFSIASSPSDELIELHIQASPEWVSAQKVIDALTSGGEVTVELPHGRACLASVPDKPLLLVAAGTGFAQVKSLVDYLRETSYDKPVKLYWGVRRHEDMYLRSLAQKWQEDWPPFNFLPVVGDDEDNDWSGHHDQLVRTVLASGMDWSDVEVHASGSPTMVYTLMDALLEAGLPQRAFFSDVLEYAPRG
ncbi:2Fe-2S iron-sulfur cluster-binding protein [Marinobacter sp. ATCH36]|uniref:2Fe-2S iron-sulfur cluster-binding protein n=1 Tax=Marinobacter sp. ATCH36 TaxID=2945106 RepID=UPI00202004E7|nr:2Fe-2S iron-sulfur cluster-binding protein [Marinobacter sp. ATCH36]MCL7945593.1 2Fe-2S iron-sulfur cluster-binding protein [Marinobacter sp. ATCH36]